MKKRIVTLFVFLLIACLTLTSCSTSESLEPDLETTEELDVDPDFVEMNCYDIGDGITIRLKTRIEDYITPDKCFRFFDLAEDLGWHEIVYSNGVVDSSLVRMFDTEPKAVFIDITDIRVCPETIYFGTIRHTEKYPYKVETVFYIRNAIPAFLNHELFYDNMPDNVYYLNDHDTCLVYFSQIVLSVYIMENFRDTSDVDIIDEILEQMNDVTWCIYE